ncbi:MAG TPA: S8 family serine peptidase [Thermoanaerobaculia bacterium]|nr:S8 family serine peptidase [Thermoanaerobaculia bacterium]
MRRILTAVLFLWATAAFGVWTPAVEPRLQPEKQTPAEAGAPYRYFILTPARLLNEQEQADLASRGLLVQGALTGHRYLVRMSKDATVADDDPRIASLTPLTADRKLHRSAVREVASGKPVARLSILFQDEVSFAEAKAAIEAAGGTLVDPLQTGFQFPRRISARIASTSVAQLAADERVLVVYGPLNLRPIAHNANSALLSNVTPLYTDPYNLTGQGVVLSTFELAAADASHREFGGRLIVHTPFSGNASSDIDHATHTAGTMIAAGVDPNAKGMAPSATLHEYDANDADAFPASASNLSAVASNNSWGYILGWCNTGKCAPWTWEEDTEIYYGNYDMLTNAPLDRLTRSEGILFVHSAGNDAGKIGPGFAPFSHSHQGFDGTITSGYCYSVDGSGNDCPAPTCKSGPTFCETTRHPQISSILPAPWVSVGLTASAKNVIAVGAVDISKQLANFSSRGPARDGRVKPDLVARGINVYSTIQNNQYTAGPVPGNGTSMAAPVITGVSALLVEQWRRTFGGQNPTPAILKTLMIATAEDLGNRGPDYAYGFGLLNAKAAVDTIIADGGQQRRIVTKPVATGDKIEIPVSLSTAQNLRVVLGWSDPEVLTFPVDSGDPNDPVAAATLVNDLDLKVIDASGNDVLPYVLDPKNPNAAATHGVNHIDNTEEVEIAGAPAGTYKIVVTGTSVTASSPQTFVVVANAELGVTQQPCTEPFGPTSTPDTAYGNLVSTQMITGRTCQTTDVDYFKFAVDRPGPVSVTVAATDTPLRVTLTSAATQSVTVDVPAGTTQTITTPFTGTTATTFFARIEPTGTIGVSARYSITPSFSYAQHGRRRAVRRAH